MYEKINEVAVIGLGSFGSSLVRQLLKENIKVLAIDMKKELVDKIANEVTAVKFDCTDENQLNIHGLKDFDLAIVAIGENFGNTVMITKLLKDMNIRVYSRASNDQEEAILKAVGADKIYRPEHNQGITEARKIAYSQFQDFIKLRANMEMLVTSPGKSMTSKNTKIRDLTIRKLYGVNIVMIGKKISGEEKQNENEEENYSYVIPDPEKNIEKDDLLWIIGSEENIKNYKNDLLKEIE